MPFPNFPDINPNINITYQEAVNLLITSVALEEISLSELIDAEKNKLLYVLNDYKHKNADISDIIDINKSVNSTIQNMTKLHVLLQNKIESIKDILPAAEKTETAAMSRADTASPNITQATDSQSESFTPAQATAGTAAAANSAAATGENDLSLKGKGKGNVSNQLDEFYLQTLFIQMSIQKSNAKNRSIYYTVQNNNSMLRLIATGYDINMEFPSSFTNTKKRILIYGKGHIEENLKHRQNISGSAKFILTVNEKAEDKLDIKMQITTETKSKLIHDSGTVEIANGSDLHIEQ